VCFASRGAVLLRGLLFRFVRVGRAGATGGTGARAFGRELALPSLDVPQLGLELALLATLRGHRVMNLAPRVRLLAHKLVAGDDEILAGREDFGPPSAR
jgi:hypothetical protein